MKSARQHLVMSALVGLISWSTALPAMTAASEKMFCQLKKDRAAVARIVDNAESVGTVCEEVTRLVMFQEYPESDYTILTGVEYWTADQPSNPRWPKGELDVVVIEEATRRAVYVAEVKCPLPEEVDWLLGKAHKQMDRFRNSLRQDSVTRMLWEDRTTVDPTTFDLDNLTIESYGPLGTQEQGFDRELPYSRADMMEMADILEGNRPDNINCR